VLQYSKLRRAPEDGPLAETVAADAVVRECVDAVWALAESQGSELRVEGMPGLFVRANRSAVRQILINLLDNALKYGPSGQVVTLRVTAGEHSVRFAVDDEGPGVPKADRKRIWEPYRRLPRDIRAGHPGTGIGLAVVSRLARVHGGRAWIEDAPEGGVRFVVELRRAFSRGTGRGAGEGPGAEGSVDRDASPTGDAAADPAVGFPSAGEVGS
ncbi:MAG: sensor histidine kinase, partial [bacterium]